MSFAEALGRQQEAIFARLGEDATWSGVADPVRVIRREADEELTLGEGAVIVPGRKLRVRKSEVAAPARGQIVQILDDDGAPISGALFTVAGEPRLDRRGVWHCPASEA